jgi:hypothetical protein
MILHRHILGNEFERKLKSLIHNKEIDLGGNIKLKIYGTLKCKSGKRMKMVNRIFFRSEDEASVAGCRPCGHCMKQEYKIRKEKKFLQN